MSANPINYVDSHKVPSGTANRPSRSAALRWSRIIDDEDVDGFINLGVRMFWGRTSFTITGFRPLTDDSDGLIAIPIVMLSRHW